MWAVEHSIETSATAEAVWRLWADVEGPSGTPAWSGSSFAARSPLVARS
jgi:hypothetical protein